jgi:hypothetical protein
MSPGSKRQKPGRRDRVRSDAGLSDRELAVMQTLARHGGGPAETSQLSMRHWPPALDLMLAWFGLDKATVADIQSRYPASHLAERVALGHFLRHLGKTAPEQLARLDPSFQQVMDNDKLTVWIRQAIDSEVVLPEEFMTRPRHPSKEIVSSKVKATLRAMADKGLIIADEMPVRRREGSGQLLWYLTPKGRQLLAEASGRDISEILYRRSGSLSDFKLKHHLRCVDLGLSIELAAERLGYQIIKQFTDEELHKLLDKEDVDYTYRRNPHDPKAPDEHVKGIHIPDHFVLLVANGRLFGQFFEVDRAEITVHSEKPQLRDFKQRIYKMTAMYRSGLYDRIFGGGKSFRYLTITSGGVDATGRHERIQSLREVAKAAIDELNQADTENDNVYQRYLFARWTEVVKPSVTDFFSAETIFDAPAFVSCDDSFGPQPLIWKKKE